MFEGCQLITPNMNLILPTPSTTHGPLYASENNDAFGQVDSHDHTSGKGLRVPAAGINIDADLTFAHFNATDLRTVRFQNQSQALGELTDIGCSYVAGGNLFYNDTSGVQIQLTAGGALNAASIGGIGGDYSTSDASVYYQSPNETFYFTSDTNIPASINAGSVLVREPVVNSNAITVQSPTSLAAGYSLTLPAVLPVSAQVVSISSTGVLATGVANTVNTIDLSAGSVTKPKQAAVGQQISSSCGSTSTSSGSFGAITNLSVTLTTSGRPVCIGLISDGTASASTIGMHIITPTGTSYTGRANFRIVRGVTSIAVHSIILDGALFNATTIVNDIPSSSLSIIDAVAAGTYTYTVEFSTSSSTGTPNAICANAKLFAYEL